MDIFLIILIIIIILLGILNIKKDIYESFITESTNTPNVMFVNESIYNKKQEIKHYTISLVFKKPKQTKQTKQQNLLCYKDQWRVYIENNILYLTDYNTPNTSKEYGSENIISAVLEKQNPKTDDLHSLGENTYYHLAVIVQKLNNKSKVFLFLNGLQGDITINSNSKSINFQNFKRKIQVGYKCESKDKDKDKFNGEFLDLKFFNKHKNEEELCALWESCNLCDYSLQNSSANTENECLTECNKLCSSSECKTKCKDWKPKCSFEPSGNTLKFCTHECMNDLTNSCRYDECAQICNECTDTISCPWNKKTDDGPTLNLNSLTCKKIIPPELHFNVLTGNKLKIIWDHPKQIEVTDSNQLKKCKQYDNTINMFILIIKTNEINDGHRIITKLVDPEWIVNLNKYNEDPTTTHTYNNSKKWSPIHSYIIDNLDDNTEYIISCKSIIQNGDNCNGDESTKTPTETKHTISDSSFHYNITLSSLKNKFLNDRAKLL